MKWPINQGKTKGEKMQKLTREQSEYIWEHVKCPDCHGDLLEGPHGGSSINVKCSNPLCGHEFNVPPKNTFLVERIGQEKKRMILHGMIMAKHPDPHFPDPDDHESHYYDRDDHVLRDDN